MLEHLRLGCSMDIIIISRALSSLTYYTLHPAGPIEISRHYLIYVVLSRLGVGKAVSLGFARYYISISLVVKYDIIQEV